MHRGTHGAVRFTHAGAKDGFLRKDVKIRNPQEEAKKGGRCTTHLIIRLCESSSRPFPGLALVLRHERSQAASRPEVVVETFRFVSPWPSKALSHGSTHVPPREPQPGCLPNWIGTTTTSVLNSVHHLIHPTGTKLPINAPITKPQASAVCGLGKDNGGKPFQYNPCSWRTSSEAFWPWSSQPTNQSSLQSSRDPVRSFSVLFVLVIDARHGLDHRIMASMPFSQTNKTRALKVWELLGGATCGCGDAGDVHSWSLACSGIALGSHSGVNICILSLKDHPITHRWSTGLSPTRESALRAFSPHPAKKPHRKVGDHERKVISTTHVFQQYQKR